MTAGRTSDRKSMPVRSSPHLPMSERGKGPGVSAAAMRPRGCGGKDIPSAMRGNRRGLHDGALSPGNSQAFQPGGFNAPLQAGNLTQLRKGPYIPFFGRVGAPHFGQAGYSSIGIGSVSPSVVPFPRRARVGTRVMSACQPHPNPHSRYWPCLSRRIFAGAPQSAHRSPLPPDDPCPCSPSARVKGERRRRRAGFDTLDMTAPETPPRPSGSRAPIQRIRSSIRHAL